MLAVNLARAARQASPKGVDCESALAVSGVFETKSTYASIYQPYMARDIKTM